VMELRDKNLIPPDSVFMLGHSAVFALYIPAKLAGKKNVFAGNPVAVLHSEFLQLKSKKGFRRKDTELFRHVRYIVQHF